MSESFLLLCHAGVTLIMVGIMWSVQLAIYPQFRAVPSEDFTRYVSKPRLPNRPPAGSVRAG